MTISNGGGITIDNPVKLPIDLATEVTGTLSIANGGFGAPSATNLSIPYVSGGAYTTTGQLQYDSTSGRFTVDRSGTYSWLNNKGVARLYDNNTDDALIYAETSFVDFRTQPLIQIYDTGYNYPVFEILPQSNGISLYDASSFVTRALTVDFGLWQFQGGLLAEQISFQNLSNFQIPCIFTCPSGQTADVIRANVGSNTRFRLLPGGEVVINSITNTSDSFLHVNGCVGFPIRTITSNRTLDKTDYHVRVDTAGGAVTVTLPTATTCTGRVYVIKRISAGVNNVTINTTSSQTIDGSTTRTLITQYASITVISNGTNWDIESQL